MFHDGDDDDGKKTEQQPDLEQAGNYNLGDDLTLAGEGHDPAEDEVI